MTAIIEINHLKKNFGENEVLKDISTTVNKGQVLSIIGASGSGNRPFYDASTYWKNRRVDKSFIKAKMCWKKDIAYQNIVPI